MEVSNSEHLALPHGFGNPIWLELGSRNAFIFFPSEKQNSLTQNDTTVHLKCYLLQ